MQAVYHSVNKSQAEYLKQHKQNLKSGECIILGDFAENYFFVVQDAVPGHH